VKVLVTGGAGFIGSAVVAQLEKHGHTAVVLDHAHGGDIRQPIEAEADHVIHLAGMLGTHELFDTVEEAIDVNVNGTLNVLRWCHQHGAGYTDITMPPVFPSVYTATKLCAGHLAKAWHHTYGVATSHVRAFNAFGPGQKHGAGHPRKIIPAFSTEAWAGEPIKIWGNGEQTVDLVHVDDVARMLVDAISFGDGETFDAGTGTPLRVSDVALHVRNYTGRRSDLEFLPMRRGEVPTFIAAEGEGWDLLDWRPQFRFEDLEATVRSYQ